MSNANVGSKVIIRGNEFVARDLSGYIALINSDNKTALIELDEPLDHTGTMYRYVVAAIRLAKGDYGELTVDRVLGCSVTWVPDESYNPYDPMDLTWWRGGGAAVTDVCLN